MRNFNPICGVFLLLIFFGFHINNSAQSEVLNNEQIISLIQSGLDKQLIVKKIETSNSNFDLSIDSLIKLKKENIPDEVLAAMLETKTGKKPSTVSNTALADNNSNDPMSPHSFGIYLFEEVNGSKTLTQIAPNISSQNRIGGMFTAAVTPFGLGKIKLKANLPGTTSSLQLNNPRPVFYFYLDISSGGLNTSSGIPSTPNEFALIKFHIRSDNREITIAKSNRWGSKGGLSDESVFDFTAENLGNGVFKITPKTELKKGEYGFYLINSGNSNTGSAVGAKFFDFGIKQIE